METKRFSGMGLIVRLLSAALLAAALIAAALIYSGAVSDRPVVGSFSGSLSSGAYAYPEIMDLETLKAYLGIYPAANDETDFESQSFGSAQESAAAPIGLSSYDDADKRLLDALGDDILSGKWPEFPYVKLGDKLYFSRQAVEQWFRDQAEKRLTIE